MVWQVRDPRENGMVQGSTRCRQEWGDHPSRRREKAMGTKRGAPPARHRSLQPAEPPPEFFHRGRLCSLTEVGIPTSVFCPKNPRSIADGVFFSPFTRPAINPGLGAGLPPSILGWAQDCPRQSWAGRRIAPPTPALTAGLHYEQLGLGTVLARA